MATKKITLSGRELTLSPLTLGDLLHCEPLLLPSAQDQNKSAFVRMREQSEAILRSINKLHPEMTGEQLLELLTAENFNHAFREVIEVSGLAVASAGEAKPAAN